MRAKSTWTQSLLIASVAITGGACMLDGSLSEGIALWARLQITEIEILQNGRLQSIRGNSWPALDPDQPFELHWTANGESGWMDVMVMPSRPRPDGGVDYFEEARLSFDVPLGCAKHYAARVSSLPAGWRYELTLEYGRSEQPADTAPCPGIDFTPPMEVSPSTAPSGWRGWFRFDSLPAVAQSPSVTISRIP